MSVIRPTLLLAGFVTLVVAWFGPLPQLATHYFSAHMTLHMSVVAVAAPLIALGVARGQFDPAGSFPRLFSAVPASVVELVVVWIWHSPALHHFARGSLTGLLMEQFTFLAAGLILWISAVGGNAGHSRSRAGAGVVALLLTSMHMTLLGALIALAPRPLYVHLGSTSADAALAEQHLGGVIMLAVGGIVYLAGGLALMAETLRARTSSAVAKPSAYSQPSGV